MGSDSDKESAAPAKRESLWLLDRADGLMRGIAMAGWLSVASLYRVPRAIVARDSVTRIDALVSGQRVLPSTLALFVAALASALTIALGALPAYATYEALQRLSSTSAENWLLVAGPGLVALWVTAFTLGGVLKAAFGRDAIDPTATLMQAVATFTVLFCALLLAFEMLPYQALRYRQTLRTAIDISFAAAALALVMMLPLAGWRCGQQAFAKSSAGRWRRYCVAWLLAPACFLGAVPSAIVMQIWLSATVMPKLDGGSSGKASPVVPSYGSECFTVENALLCQFVLRPYQDLVVGALEKLQIQLQPAGPNTTARSFVLRAELGQVEQRSPRADIGNFWKLRRYEPTPVALQIPRKDICEELKTLEEMPTKRMEIAFDAAWYPGFTSLYQDGKSIAYRTSGRPKSVLDLSRFCAQRPARAVK